MINRTSKWILISLLSFYSILCKGQAHQFVSGVFFNANGIHIEGDKHEYWNNSNGTIWGSGGVSVGLYTKRRVSKSFYFNLELRYIQKGSIYEFTNQYATQSYETLRLNYLELPLSIGYVMQTKKNNYFIETGIASAKLFSSKLNIDKLAFRIENPNANDFKDYDFSLFASVKFPINKSGKENMLLGARASYSLFSTHKTYSLRNLVYGVQFDYLLNK